MLLGAFRSFDQLACVTFPRVILYMLHLYNALEASGEERGPKKRLSGPGLYIPKMMWSGELLLYGSMIRRHLTECRNILFIESYYSGSPLPLYIWHDPAIVYSLCLV
jgi:hypothetical protein